MQRAALVAALFLARSTTSYFPVAIAYLNGYCGKDSAANLKPNAESE
jgi:hypothetical protein